MPTNIPLHLLIPQILGHTPDWVWALLVGITLIGLSQLRSQAISLPRLVFVPIIMATLSLWSALGSFGVQAAPIIGWIVGLAGALLVNRVLKWPGTVGRDTQGRYTVAGSVLPLLLIWGIFIMRYTVAVSLLMHPSWVRDTGFALTACAAYGLLSGLFTARALRIANSQGFPAPNSSATIA